MNDFITSIENICEGLVNTFQEILTWKCESRFGAVLATWTTESKDDVQWSLENNWKTNSDNSMI